MHIHNFSNQNTILNTFIAEMRDVTIQKDSMRFRRNIERIGEILGYELSKTLSYKPTTVKTPLGICEIEKIDNKVVLCSILRAGVPLH
ncbi:MAG TPA: uracil phosphoribosyltransferase, partial [Xanthomarina gelatinilytica]|nr:uracil phosphoribosyltransferase [Xanthomarina gelatinilytica]